MTEDGGYDGPRYTVADLSDDQRAMLALLGGVEARPRRSVALFCETPPGLAKVADGLSPHVVKDHPCPIVEFRASLRMILPNGDVWSVRDDESA